MLLLEMMIPPRKELIPQKGKEDRGKREQARRRLEKSTATTTEEDKATMPETDN